LFVETDLDYVMIQTIHKYLFTKHLLMHKARIEIDRMNLDREKKDWGIEA